MICITNAVCRAGLVSILGLLTAQGAGAADDKGQYGVRGAGLLNCAAFERERQAGSPIYHVVAGWMDGYITGSNQHAEGTYDITSFESTEMLAAVISENCKQHPDTPVFAVLRSLMNQASKDRLLVPSDKITVAIGDRSILLYQEVLKRVQQKLADGGFYMGTIDGSFDTSTREALQRFQQSKNLKPTGFPDQVTLWRLLKADN